MRKLAGFGVAVLLLTVSSGAALRPIDADRLLNHIKILASDEMKGRAGGPELDRDELWDRYRTGALYAYVAALITAGMGGMQAEGIAMEGLRRAVAALEDLDTVALLEKSL